MARKRQKGSPETKAKGARRKAAPAATADVVEEVEGQGVGLEGGIAITTFLCLIGALTLVIAALQRYP